MLKETSLLLRGLLTPEVKPARGKFITDDASDDDSDTPGPAATAATSGLRLQAAAIVQAWVATDDLADDETLSDRLLALVMGAIDADKDGDISDDEAQVADMLLNFVWDYMSDKGVSDEDLTALLDDGDNDAAGRVKDLLAESAPADDEAAADDMDSFAFDTDSETPIFDSTGEVIYDATYKKKIVVKHGHKTKVNRRVSGTVRLTAKQKIAVRKMQRKSHTASAVIKRIKSMKVRAASGI